MSKGRIRNRHKLRIIYDILDCCSAKPLIISHIARKANVSSLPFYKVINGLITAGLLTKQEIGKPTFYKTSPTGHNFIKKYDDLLFMVKPLLDTSEAFIVKSDTD
ncbi:MAG: winged helix-turn-helix domain-containing protein [Candidatus Bathyarchaeia archaeon]|jgi:predicted transcriptional regulator